VRGVPFQSQRVQEEQVLSGPEFERETALLAQKLKLPSEHVNALARREFRTISANPVRWIFTVSAAIARLIIRQLFSEVTIVGMKQFAEATKDAAVVLVPMHRSHLDYILVGSVLYESRLNTPLRLD
jgi:glycerol-3-phosphate O-acyltransferase